MLQEEQKPLPSAPPPPSSAPPPPSRASSERFLWPDEADSALAGSFGGETPSAPSAPLLESGFARASSDAPAGNLGAEQAFLVDGEECFDGWKEEQRAGLLALLSRSGWWSTAYRVVVLNPGNRKRGIVVLDAPLPRATRLFQQLQTRVPEPILRADEPWASYRELAVPEKLHALLRPEPVAAVEVDVCPICFEDIDPSAAAMRCGGTHPHYCHAQCLQAWVQSCQSRGSRPSCPTCRADVEVHSERLENLLRNPGGETISEDERSFLERLLNISRDGNGEWSTVLTRENVTYYAGVLGGAAAGFVGGYAGRSREVRFLEHDRLLGILAPRHVRVAHAVGFGAGALLRTVQDYKSERREERSRSRSHTERRSPYRR